MGNPQADQRKAGLLVPLFAIRGSDDFGFGDVRSLRELIDWCAEIGFGVINLLPLNEPGGDPSPYNPISAMAIDPLSISLLPDDLPDIGERVYQRIIGDADLAALRNGPVSYPAVRALKAQLSEAAFEHFEKDHLKKGTARAAEFRAFTQTEAEWLHSYTLFRVLMERHGHERWSDWPREQQTAAAAEVWLRSLSFAERENLERRRYFHGYVQWVAQTQWSALHEYARARRVELMGDIALGVNFYSADVFAQPELFDLQWSCGAPPDAMSVGSPQEIAPVDPFRAQWGQNWGFPLYNWDAMQRDGLRWWRRRIRRLCALVDLFRIDHILGFYRVYAFPWRPEQNGEFIGLNESESRRRSGGKMPRFLPRGDDSPGDREANRVQGETLLRLLVEEAGAGSLIGEDLGCVPDYVRPSLHRLGIAGYKVPSWEQAKDGSLIPGTSYERLSVAMYVTHDHAPLRAQWREWAQTIREATNDPDKVKSAEAALRNMLQLWRFAGQPASEPAPLEFEERLHRALIAALMRANSWLVIFMITDLFAREERFNVPGAIGEANWTQRMHVPIRELDQQPQTKWIRALLRETGRAVGRQSEAGKEQRTPMLSFVMKPSPAKRPRGDAAGSKVKRRRNPIPGAKRKPVASGKDHGSEVEQAKKTAG